MTLIYIDKLIINTNSESFDLNNLISEKKKESTVSSEKAEPTDTKELLVEENKNNDIEKKPNNVVSMASFRKEKGSKKRSNISILRKELFIEVMNDLTKQPSDYIKKCEIISEITSRVHDNKELRDVVINSYDKEGVLSNSDYGWNSFIIDPEAKIPDSFEYTKVMAKLCLDEYLKKYDECGNLSFMSDPNLDEETKNNFFKGHKTFYNCVDYVFSQDISTLVSDGKIKRVEYGVYSLA